MTEEQEQKLEAMSLTPKEESIVRQIVDLLTEEQRDKQGQFADESKINTSAGAKLRYLDSEGFLKP